MAIFSASFPSTLNGIEHRFQKVESKCELVIAKVFRKCVSVLSRKVEASLPGPCRGGSTC